MFVQHKTRRKATVCTNCETVLGTNVNFCPTCGQENHDATHISIGHLLYETIEGIWHFDSKFWTTFKSIVTKPGQISLDFLQGRRSRYVPPIRLYIFVSAFFFWFAGISVDYGIKSNLKSPNKNGNYNLFELPDNSLPRELDKNFNVLFTDFVRRNQRKAFWVSDSVFAKSTNRNALYCQLLADNFEQYLANRGIKLSARQHDQLFKLKQKELGDVKRDTLVWQRNGQGQQVRRYDIIGRIMMDSTTTAKIENEYSASQIDSLIVSANPKNSTWWRRIPLRWILKSAQNLEQNEANIAGTILRTIKNASIAMFFLMPFVAFLLWAFFKNKYPFYAQHLVVAIYTHAVAYLILLLFFATEFLPKSMTEDNILQLSFLVMAWLYTGLSFKRTYAQSWPQFVVKYLIATVFYFAVLAATVVGMFGYNMLFGQ